MKFFYKVCLDSLNKASSRGSSSKSNYSEQFRGPECRFLESGKGTFKAWLKRRKFRNIARSLLQKDDQLLIDIDIPRGELIWALSLPVQIDVEKVLSELREQRRSERWVGKSERYCSKHEITRLCK